MFTELRVETIKTLIVFNERMVFEKRLRKYFTAKTKGRLNVVIDVGANDGQTIDFYLKVNPQCKIFGFEPNPTLFKKLLVKYAPNKNVKIYNLGISDKSGKKEFYENVLD